MNLATRFKKTRSKKQIATFMAIPVLLLIILSMSYKLFMVDEDIYRSKTDLVADQIHLALELFPKPVVDNLMAEREKALGSGMDISNINGLTNKFIPILQQNPHIDSINMATSNGSEYMLKRDGDTWINRSRNATDKKQDYTFHKWSLNGANNQRWQEKLDYDPCQTYWYKGAIRDAHEGKIFWSKPYKFFHSKETGISASVKWKSPNEDLLHVMAINISLPSILKFEQTFKISQQMLIFLLDDDGKVLKLNFGEITAEDPAIKQFNDKKISSDTIVSMTVDRWKENKNNPEGSFNLKIEGAQWWGCLKPFSLAGMNFQAGIIIPEKDLMPEARKRQGLIMAIMVGVTAIGIIVTILLTKRSHPFNRGKRFPGKNRYGSKAGLMDLINSGESELLEFKSTMRWNLKAGKAGKEIELAWLKTVAAYMNTNGGILLIGVDDDGEITGMDADNFQNEDKCLLHFNNLIKQHIGLEFSRFIHFQMVEISGKHVFAVECIASSQPVFLKNNKDEFFYVRSGPSSTKLTMSEALKYINEKKIRV